MIDAQLLRQRPQEAAENLKKRNFVLDVAAAQKIEARRKTAQEQTEALRARRNEAARAVAQAKQKGETASDLIKQAEAVNADLQTAEAELGEAQEQWRAFALDLPNLLHESVPAGKGEADNPQVKQWGTPPAFDFVAKDHVALGEAAAQMDFAAAAKLASARFVTLRGELAQLHRALTQFMLDLHTQEHGYTEAYMPYLANAETLTGTGQLPKFADDLFFAERDGLYLIPTAEVALTNLARDALPAADALPQKFVCHTPCFRREAGSYGKDTRGMLRQHQFEKVELVHFSAPENSYEQLEAMTSAAEAVLQRLQLPYRVVSLCGGDIGFAAAKTYDIEVWLPGQNAYREISSCSNCEAFQARRMKARYKTGNGKNEFIHTLNGSGVAVGRALIAVLENRQQADGSVVVPEALRPFMRGKERILAGGQ
jgi:seryl-tRNA synthetase